MDVSEDELQGLYTWVDEIPLSRPKRSIARDFSDGVLVAEIVAHYFPKYVELHNYSSASSLTQKIYNWNTLNQKAFRKMNFSASKTDFEAICNCAPGAIERFLKLLQVKIAKHRGKVQGGFRAPDGMDSYRGPPQDPLAPPPDVHHMLPGSPATEAQGHYQQQQYQQQQQPYQPPHNLSHPSPPPSQPSTIPNHDSGASVLADRDATISELQETNEILELKVRKLEQLVRLKDAKIQTLMAKLQTAERTT